MLNVTRIVLLAITVALATSPVAARYAVLPLEERIAESDLAVVGRVVELGDSFGLDKLPGMLRGKILVERVLMGDLDGRSVEFLYAKPPDNARGLRPLPVVYQVGQEQLWLLKRHETVAGNYTVVAPRQAEPPARADTAEVVIAAAAEPLKTLREAEAASRLKRSAAFFVLRRAVPLSQLPTTTRIVETDGGRIEKQTPDLRGHELLDDATLDLAVATAIDAFSEHDDEVHEVSRRTLARVGCPVDGLEPPLPDEVRATTAEQIRVFQKTHQQAWARAIRKWWTDNHRTIKRYVPKKPAADAPAATSAPQDPSP
ncbi:MAG: hypothetical protein JXL80_04565 [Planctomycetes bacterium]|nr:hypothetical protein [Planctomycetota bacterium]